MTSALRGFTEPQRERPLSRLSWEELDTSGKTQTIIRLITKPGFVGKGDKPSGEEAWMLKIEKEPGLASEIISTPDGREAVIDFIKTLYRSEGGVRGYRNAQRALRLFALEMTADEQKAIRDAELDSRAFAIAEDDIAKGWRDGLTESEKIEVDSRANVFREQIRRRRERD